MHWLCRLTVLFVVAGSLTLTACVESNDIPEVSARVEAFSATPQVLHPGERTDLRWRVTDALVFRLARLNESAMPDATQPWRCHRAGTNMVCTAPNIPESADGWDCSDESCSRAIDEEQEEAYLPIDVTPTTVDAGSFEVWPGVTSTYRIEVEGNTGAIDIAWIQVAVTTAERARILSFTAYPTPAIVGEPVSLFYITEGCDSVQTPTATPPLDAGELVSDDDNTNRNGSFVWQAATETRDFYLSCPDEGLRSHITIPVIQMPDICEQIERFDVSPTDRVPAGTEVTVSWRVINADSISGSADPEPSRPFYIGSSVFEGTWRGAIEEETTFTISATGECFGVEESQVVEIVEDCVPECGARECGDDGCGGSCGACPVTQICDPEGSGLCING